MVNNQNKQLITNKLLQNDPIAKILTHGHGSR